MKKRTGLILFLLFLTPQICFAQFTKTITINWAWTPDSNITVNGYTMHFAYDSLMTTQQQACTTSDPNVNFLTCTDISFTQPQVYFTITANTSAGNFVTNPPKTADVSTSTTISGVNGFERKL